jgi:hypothetical protein
MNQTHYYVEILLKERHKELLDQARIGSQLRVNDAERRVKIDLGAVFSRIKAALIPGRIASQPVEPVQDCIPAAECQPC